MKYFVASCTFASWYPELNRRIREYAMSMGLVVVRCCVQGWKIGEYEDKMPEGELRDAWRALPHSAEFQPGDEVWSICHNCSNIIEEMHPGVAVHSLWELVDADPEFTLPDYSGLKVTVQDCWRAKERTEEQAAVRSLLGKMKIEYAEAEKHHGQTDFCGTSLYRAQVERNPKLAPKHYAEGAVGKFIPHSEEEQARIMKEYCAKYTTETVVCYCHNCLEGLEVGGVDGRHIAHMLFREN